MKVCHIFTTMNRAHKKILMRASEIISITVLIFTLNFSLFTFSSSAQVLDIPRNSDSTFYRVEFALNNPQKCYYLFLEYDSLETLPDMSALSNLRGIAFRHCTRMNFNQAISKLSVLPNLEYFEISISALPKLPGSISTLSHLQTLNLKANSLQILPEEISDCASLKNIILPYNSSLRLEELFSRLGKLKTLEHLDLSGNQFRILPDAIGDLSNLKKLDLGSNYFVQLPTSISSCTSLEEIDLSNCLALDFKQACTVLSKISTLKKINISSSNIKELPESLGTIISLENIDASGNSLISLPNSIGKLTNLKILNIGSENRSLTGTTIEKFPSSFANCISMQTLILRGNFLTTLPDLSKMKNLEELDVSWCGMGELPSYIKSLTGLTYLRAAHNYFQVLPEWIGELQYLKVLELDGNFFPNRTVPHLLKLPESIGNLKNLEVLTLDDQIIKVLPESIIQLTSLKALHLRNNALIVLPEDFGNFSQLEILDLKANDLKTLPESFNSLKNLQQLNLSFNPNIDVIQMMGAVQHLTQLKRLDISFIPISKTYLSEFKKALPTTTIFSKTNADLNFQPDKTVDEQK